ncbi:hypothetical protein [Rhizobium sp. ZW T2_16]|uniref:hypothetical protein n=1 Tax=Rhizobium sp. ZW T2_16 TaxID=3378083 RepID=UPI0038545443
MKVLALLFLLLSTPALAAQPFARASIDGSEKLVAGQQVHIVVDVFVPDFFTSPPQFPLFEVADALVTLSSDRAQNIVQTIDATQYSVIRKAYIVVPERSGSFSLPMIEVELGYSANGKSTKTVVHVALPSFDVTASVGPIPSMFAARRLTLTETFDRDPAHLRPGDALVRTVLVTAEDTQAMLIPPVDVGLAEGAAQYPKQPVLLDGVPQRSVGRSVETGSTRTETIVYTVPEAGLLRLPEVSYRWFDLESHSAATASLPAVEVVVAAAPADEPKGIAPVIDEVPAEHGSVLWPTLLALVLIDLAAGLLAWRYLPEVRARVRQVRKERRNSPAKMLRRLQAVIKTEDDAAIYRALQHWIGKQGYATLADWTSSEQNTRLQTQVAILERRLFRSDDVLLDRQVLADAIVIPRPAGRGARSALPELNPSA